MGKMENEDEEKRGEREKEEDDALDYPTWLGKM